MAVLTLLQAVNDALSTEMGLDDSVVLLGEDIGKTGGVFRATDGLQETYGVDRVFDTPLSEAGIIGSAIGMALYGLRPVAEIQFMDFIYPAFDQIVSEAAKFRYRSGGEYTAPMVIRTPAGGGIRGGHYHSQSSEAYFAHTPGLKIVYPATPYDAKGLLIASIRDEDPVMFLEPKRIYRTAKAEVPEGDYTVEIGEARIAREGTDVTIVGWGAIVETCERAANLIEEEKGWSCEVIDLRTLVPYDAETVLESIRKTGRMIVVHEAPKTCGYGAEMVALAAEKAIEYLEAPVLRVAGFDTPFPYTLEHIYVPDIRRINSAVRKVMEF